MENIQRTTLGPIGQSEAIKIFKITTLSQGGQRGNIGRIGCGGHASGHGRTGAGQGEQPPPGHTEHFLMSFQEATQGLVV